MQHRILAGLALVASTAGCGLSDEQRKAEALIEADVIADAECAGVFELASRFTGPEYAKTYSEKSARLKAMASEAEKKLPSAGSETRTDKLMREASATLGAHIQEADWSAEMVAKEDECDKLLK